MNASILLAQVFGILSMLSGGYMLTKKDEVTEIYRRFASTRSVLRSGGFLELAAGLFIVLGHPVFSGWQLIITLIGVAALIEGGFYVFAPQQQVRHLFRSFFSSNVYTFTAATLLVLGAFLAYNGFLL